MGKDKGLIWTPGWTGVFTLDTPWDTGMEGRGCSGDWLVSGEFYRVKAIAEMEESQEGYSRA